MGWLKDMLGGGDSYRGNYEYAAEIKNKTGDPWLWKQDWRVWGSPAVRNLMQPRLGQRLFQQEGAAIDRAYSTARTNALAGLNRAGLSNTGAGALLSREMGTMRGQALGEARSRTQLQADTTQAEFSANYWGNALNRQLQAKGMRYSWLANADKIQAETMMQQNALKSSQWGAIGAGLGGMDWGSIFNKAMFAVSPGV